MILLLIVSHYKAVVRMIIVMIYFCKTKYKAEDLKDIYTRNVSICVNNKSILLLGFIYYICIKRWTFVLDSACF